MINYTEAITEFVPEHIVERCTILGGAFKKREMYMDSMRFSGRHERICVNPDGSFDIYFIIRGIQYRAKAMLPPDIDPLDIKWYCRSIASEYRGNKLRKILRKEIW